MLNAAAETFIWELLRLGLLVGNLKQASEWVRSFYDRGIDISTKLETLLAECFSCMDRTALLLLARAVLEDFCLGVEHRTRLTAYLFAAGDIDVTLAYTFLGFDGVNVDDLELSVRRVADVHWLVRQDIESGRMEPGDDCLLGEALCALAGKAH